MIIIIIIIIIIIVIVVRVFVVLTWCWQSIRLIEQRMQIDFPMLDRAIWSGRKRWSFRLDVVRKVHALVQRRTKNFPARRIPSFRLAIVWQMDTRRRSIVQHLEKENQTKRRSILGFDVSINQSQMIPSTSIKGRKRFNMIHVHIIVHYRRHLTIILVSIIIISIIGKQRRFPRIMSIKISNTLNRVYEAKQLFHFQQNIRDVLLMRSVGRPSTRKQQHHHQSKNPP